MMYCATWVQVTDFMPPEHRAEQHAEEPDEDADVEVEPDEARDDQADAGDLRDQVGEGARDAPTTPDHAGELPPKRAPRKSGIVYAPNWRR